MLTPLRLAGTFDQELESPGRKAPMSVESAASLRITRGSGRGFGRRRRGT